MYVFYLLVLRLDVLVMVGLKGFVGCFVWSCYGLMRFSSDVFLVFIIVR